MHPAFAVLTLAVFSTVIFSSSASAQTYPQRPIRIVVPYAPGGGADNVARIIAPKLSDALGQPIVIDNRGGAAGAVGAEVVAKSKPDGYTLLDDASAHAVNPALRKLPFDTVRDFAPIGMIVVNPNLLVAHPSLPVQSLRELLGLARQRPGQITYASAGVGSTPHMAVELLKYMAKIDMVHIPYKGGGAVLPNLLGGHVQLFMPTIATALGHVKAGKLKSLAITSARRSRAAPDIPTIAESGLPGYELYEWNALFAPAGTPMDIVGRLNAELVKVLSAAEIQERLFQLGAEAAPGTPEQLARHVNTEMARWEKVVRELGIKAQD